MGILQNVRDRVVGKVHEYHERRESDRQEYQEHYGAAYDSARKAEIKKAAETKAKQDAYNRVHPMDRVVKGFQRIQGMGGSVDRAASGGRVSGNSLGRKMAPLGDFGRSIGQGYNNMGNHLPAALRDFDKPNAPRKQPKKRSITINY